MNGKTVSQPFIEAENLTKHYGKTIALHEVDMQVREGITGLLGPNGAGKSTAMKLFLGLLRPTAGVATVLGEKPYEDVAIRMLGISVAGLVARKRIGPGGNDESKYVETLVEIAESGQTRAQMMLEKYATRWDGSVDPIFTEFAY